MKAFAAILAVVVLCAVPALYAQDASKNDLPFTVSDFAGWPNLRVYHIPASGA